MQIIRYQIVSDALTTHRLREPDSALLDGPLCTELCTLDDGYTYVSVPDGVTLPDTQPATVAAIGYLEQLGILGAGREAEILA